MNELVRVVKADKGYAIEVVDEKVRKFIKEEYIAEIEYLIEALIEEFERNNLNYKILTEGFEIVIQAKPAKPEYNVHITVELGKETTYIAMSKYNIINNEDITIFSFMFVEPVLVKIMSSNDISLTNFDGKTKYNAIISKLEQITIRIDLKDQFITFYIN